MFFRITSVIFLLSLTLFLAKSSPTRQNLKSGNCIVCHPTVNGKINVHLVPHSHDDAGWLKTVDQYYYGSGRYSTYEGAGVQYIISTMVQALKSNPDRRYIQVETIFFWKWWQKQNDIVKQNVIDLVNNGQLEFVNAAMSMNDEAATNYMSIIDQYTWGFRILNDTIGECAKVKVGWQIDPFGHSREHASINRQLGFEGLVIGRLDYRDKNKRILNKDLDFVWKSSANLEDSGIFTTIFPDFYLADDGFRFDITFEQSPINDDPDSPDYNLPQMVDDFVKIMDNYRNYYKTDNILIPMGGDFTYQDAELSFTNIDRLIKGFEQHDTYNLIYSTPSCFIEAVNEEVNNNSIKLVEKTDDFFPYASDAHSYWTGYFTSRPTTKRFERTGNNIMQAAKQLAAFSKALGNDVDKSLNNLRETMGVLQHHDAITGTEKQAVTDDYSRMLAKAIAEAEQPLSETISNLLKKSPSTDIDLQLSSCPLANVSICETSTNDKFLVSVYNPLSKNVSHYVRIPVDGDNYKITGPDGDVDFDVFNSISTFDWIIEPELTVNPKELVFLASDLPPLGVKLYFIEKLSSAETFDQTSFKPSASINFGTDDTGFSIDDNGKLSSVTINGESLAISQEFFYYNGVNSDNDGADNRASGAYIFRPVQNVALSYGEITSFQATQGQLVDELLQIYNDEVTQIIRVYKGVNDSYIEFDWLIGNLQFVEDNGKEVITRFTISNFSNENIFYTDSNGREQIKRELNKRGDYEYDASVEPVTSNYYPVTSKIVVKDEDQDLEVAVLNDRAQGGSVLKDGQIELMVHRRLPHDDAFGVGEALNEIQYETGLYARGQHWLVLGSTSTTPAVERDLAQKKLLAPIVLLADATNENLDSVDKVKELFNLQYSGLKKSLPDNVKLLTLEPWSGDSYLVRLEHVFEQGEDESLSKPVTVDISDIFTSFSIGEIKETTLGADKWLEDYNRQKKLVWNGKEETTRRPRADAKAITLNPMEIRTFIVKPVSK